MLLAITAMFCIALVAAAPSQAPSQTVVVNPQPSNQSGSGNRSVVALMLVMLVLIAVVHGGRSADTGVLPVEPGEAPRQAQEAVQPPPASNAGWMNTNASL